MMRTQIREFIYDNFLHTTSRNNDLQDDESFIDSGIIDSTGILELIYFVEENFHIQIEDEELIPDNLDTVNSLINFIQKKQS